MEDMEKSGVLLFLETLATCAPIMNTVGVGGHGEPQDGLNALLRIPGFVSGRNGFQEGMLFSMPFMLKALWTSG